MGFKTMRFEIPIIYEDDGLLVINKPAGLVVHGDGLSEEETLVDWLLDKYPNLGNVGESLFTQKGIEIKKPGIVHRLDKETSGVMVVAKNQETFSLLKRKFQDHEVKKVYRAILSGRLKLNPGEEKVLDWAIGRSKKDPRIRIARQKGGGKLKEAQTVFRLLENFPSNYSYVEAVPKSGRTHQLRVHFKAYNHPIIGDYLYNPKDNGQGAIGRTALHAYSLTIENSKKEIATYRAPLPDDFEQALEKLRASC